MKLGYDLKKNTININSIDVQMFVVLFKIRNRYF